MFSSRFNVGKYRGVLISVALFILLDASVLMLNFFISFQIADDAVGVNLAGRQRMLSQRIAKSLYALEGEYRMGGRFNPDTLQELTSSATLFEDTLKAFIAGGVAQGASGERVMLQAVTDVNATAALVKANQRWDDYKKSIFTLARTELGNDRGQEHLVVALKNARSHNLPILTLMNDFTVALENIATSKANRLRWIQTVGISLAIINFLFILFHFIRQLRESDAVLDAAKNETTEILNTVNEGLFLVSQDLSIGSQYSKALENIIGVKNLQGKSLLDVLAGLVSEKEAKTTTEFVALLFNPKVKEKLIGDLNPLDEVEVILRHDSGLPETRHLSFSFSRAMAGKIISHVLVSVTDISEKVMLERELNESRESTSKQVEMLSGLLHVNPILLQDFIASAYVFYGRINNVFKVSSKSNGAMQSKLDDAFVEVHNFKGNAMSLKLESFTDRATAFEDDIARLKAKADLSGDDFLSLTVYLDEMISYTQQIETLVDKMALYGAARKAPAANLEQWKPLYTLVDSVASNQGKSVELVCSGLSELGGLPDDFIRGLKTALIQLLRNSVAHGVEPSSERLGRKKAKVGRVDVRAASIAGGSIEIVVQDDGAGINYGALRQKALASKRWSADEVEGWSRAQLASLIFYRDVSTADTLSQDAGRGVGMPAVLKWVNSLQGKIKVSSRLGLYTRFIISLPQPAAERLAA